MQSMAAKWGCLGLLAMWVTGAAAIETRTLALDTQGLRRLEVDAEQGFLRIQATTGETIEVVAAIDADSGDYELVLEKKANRAVLISKVKPWAAIFLAEWPRIDLTVKVPARMALDIDDGSGYIAIYDMRADVEIDDGSGAIVVRSLLGNLDIEDGSGPIDVSGVTGRIEIEDGSGPIRVENVIGDVSIDDGSGPMVVTNVDGRVIVKDGSGSIDVSRVKRGLMIRDAGSGSLRTSEIEGGIEER